MFEATHVSALAAWIEDGRPLLNVPYHPNAGILTCPSYPRDSGGTKFAVRTVNGSLRFVGATHFEVADEESIRLHGRCVTSRCHYWNTSCQLGSLVARSSVETSVDESDDDQFSACPISATCRWKAENGIRACRGCAAIVYGVEVDSFNRSGSEVT